MWPARFFGTRAIAIAAMLVGTASPAFGWYYALPLGNLFRLAPVRIEFLFWFAMALLTALGIHGLSAALGRYSDRKWLSTGVGLAVAGAIVWSFYARSGLAFAHPATRPPDPSATASLLGFLRERGSPERFFVENSLLQQLQDSSLPFKIGMMHRVFAVPDYEPNMPGRYARYFGMPDTPPWHGRISVTSSSSDASGLPRADLRQLDGMSVRYYITPIDSPERTVRDLEAIASGERRRFGGVLVFERDRALPRAYTIAREVRVVDDAAALEYVRSDAFAPRREVVVIGADAGAPEPGVARADSEFRPARIDRYADDAVVIAADCDVACLLVLTDLDYPGWRAWVDGTQRPVLRANGLYRAVRLEAGTHSVVYRYEPRLLYASLLLPVVAIAAWIAWSIRDRRSGRTIRSV